MNAFLTIKNTIRLINQQCVFISFTLSLMPKHVICFLNKVLAIALRLVIIFQAFTVKGYDGSQGCNSPKCQKLCLLTT